MWAAILGGLFAVLKPIAEYFNASARLARMQTQHAVDTARQEVEGERLQSAYRRIEAEPAKSNAEELAKRLREKFPKR